MFEGIKDTLGKFRSDVEEEAVEELPEEDPEDERSYKETQEDNDESPETEAEGEISGEETPDAVTTEPGTDAPGTDVEGGSPETDPTDEGSGEPTDDPSGTPADTADPDRSDADTGETDSTPGIGRRAKSLVRGRVVIDPDDLEGPLRDLEMALLRHDVEMDVADTVLDRVREELVGETRKMTKGTTSVVEDALREALLSVLAVGQFDFEERVAETETPVVIVFTGVNGVGKTTTIAKLSRYLEERGYSSVLANGDTYRAGANEQIEEHADNLGRKCIAHEQGGDPAAVVYDAVEYAEANDVDVVLGDTAGRLHTDDDLMNQLAKIDRVVGPDLTLFVDEAVAGQDAVNRAREFDAAAEVDGAILTKADADSSGGAAISVAHVTGKPILFLGVGQGYDDLESFDPEELVERLLGE